MCGRLLNNDASIVEYKAPECVIEDDPLDQRQLVYISRVLHRVADIDEQEGTLNPTFLLGFKQSIVMFEATGKAQ